ncbi:MAG TPA: Rossmann-like and DUF2520 domain-containing protein [Terriglobales bacterium]|nr:Rossmann-like and DUF2520 domain-containing protein [Terriglobales bacterium]
MSKKPSITIVGAGNVGVALALALAKADFRVNEIAYRSDRKSAAPVARRIGAKAVRSDAAEYSADLVWLCVGDRDIAFTARDLSKRSDWKGKIVFHCSGALTSDELRPLKKLGAKVAAVHPMMTFVKSSKPSFEGVAFALEGDPAALNLAKRLAKELGGTSFILKKEDKPLYHALGTFSSPLLIAHLAAAERIGKTLGLKPARTRQVIGPILRRTLENYLANGPAASFSGPIIRGDADTIARNLQALRRVPGTGQIYRALLAIAIEDLPTKNRAKIKSVLGQ